MPKHQVIDQSTIHMLQKKNETSGNVWVECNIYKDPPNCVSESEGEARSWPREEALVDSVLPGIPKGGMV